MSDCCEYKKDGTPKKTFGCNQSRGSSLREETCTVLCAAIGQAWKAGEGPQEAQEGKQSQTQTF